MPLLRRNSGSRHRRTPGPRTHRPASRKRKACEKSGGLMGEERHNTIDNFHLRRVGWIIEHRGCAAWKWMKRTPKNQRLKEEEVNSIRPFGLNRLRTLRLFL